MLERNHFKKEDEKPYLELAYSLPDTQQKLLLGCLAEYEFVNMIYESREDSLARASAIIDGRDSTISKLKSAIADAMGWLWSLYPLAGSARPEVRLAMDALGLRSQAMPRRDQEGLEPERDVRDRLLDERNRLADAIREHRKQKADDRCIEDDDRLYAALGDGIGCDRSVGDKAEMLKNCARFIDRRCTGGDWPTYAALEAERDALRLEVEVLRAGK
jgi:hypothetical protein